MIIGGSCHCGFIKYEAELNRDSVFICHCTDCQKLSASVFRTIATVKSNDFKLLSGAPKIYVKVGDSGNKREQAFCSECGSGIYSTSVGQGSKNINIRLGTVTQRNELVPTSQIWSRSAMKWLPELDGIPKVEKQ